MRFGAHVGDRAATAAAAMCVAGVLAATAAREEFLESENRTSVIVGLLFLTVAFRIAWLAGRWARRRRARQQELIAEREDEARAALADERARIARELHDVLAHAISVIVLQARGARHALASAPEDARDALGAIEGTASQALTEMLRLLTVLRAEDEAPGRAPSPRWPRSSPSSPRCARRACPWSCASRARSASWRPRSTSAPIGSSRRRSPTPSSTPGRPARGCFCATATRRSSSRVADTGTGAGNGGSAGHGLAGMRERVALFSGRLESGPRPEGGYLVRARLPL